jgi:hypothetical protein
MENTSSYFVGLISKYQQLKKKPAAAALNTLLASAHFQMT